MSLALTVALVSGFATPAFADDGTPNVIQTLQDASEYSTSPAASVLDYIADVNSPADDQDAIHAEANGAAVTVPSDPSDPISLEAPGVSSSYTVTLPFTESADDAVAEEPGIVSFDNNNGSTTVLLAKADGALQIVTVIDVTDSPLTYSYEIGLPPEGRMELSDTNTVVIYGASGEVIGGFLPPWAVDAAGKDIPTHYEIAGSVLTQIVDHNAATTIYPVIADPYAGTALLVGVYKNRPGGYSYKTGDQWSTKLTSWGLAVWTGAAFGGGVGAAGVGNAIVQLQGWTEYLSKGGKNTTTIHQQYECHVWFGYAVWLAGFWWDFETSRGTNDWWRVNPQKCNWA